MSSVLIVPCVPKSPRKPPPSAKKPRQATYQDQRVMLREHREAQGLTLEEVGARMGGKNKSYVSRLETGGIQVTELHIFQFADAIRVSPDRLFRHPGHLTLDDMVNAIPKELQASIRELVASQYKNRPK